MHRLIQTRESSHCAVDPDNFQPIRGQLNGSAEVSAKMWLGGGLIGSQRQQEVCCDADVELLSSVHCHLNVKIQEHSA